METSLEIKSYGKINWTLDVLFKREDGYHELRTIYQTVSLHDTIRLTLIPAGIEVLCDDSRVPTDDTNLAYKAADRLRQAAGIDAGARIEIQKRIPVAAGLGGGSSNAAAALMGLARLWRTDLGERDLFQVAGSLGSDVPLFLIGGTILGVGRGEEVYPLQAVDCPYLLLANAGLPVSTAEAYGGLSRLTRAESVRIMPFTLFAAKANRELPLAAANDLEETVIAAHPEIAEVKRRLKGFGARHVLMSGSGGTVFGVFENSETSELALSEMRAAGYWADLTHTIGRQEYQSSLFA
jgi:4-diphosphocytidyl-2-C-methyl-D-erythritol kinase